LYCIVDRYTDRLIDWMREWVSAWTNEWMNEWYALKNRSSCASKPRYHKTNEVLEQLITKVYEEMSCVVVVVVVVLCCVVLNSLKML